MCVISDNIKFCTCSGGSVKSLDSYWAVYRFGKRKDKWLIGDFMLPPGLLDSNFDSNKQTILKRLNQPDAFDKVIDFRNNDKLHIVFNDSTEIKEDTIYAYRFNKGKWVEDQYDYLEFETYYYRKVAKGNIENQ